MIWRFIAVSPCFIQVLLSCTCIGSNPCGTDRSAEAVFVGVAERDEMVRVRGVARIVHTFAVIENLRGELPGKVEVATGLESCDAVFEKGKSYLVFVRSIDGRLETNLCAGNRPLDRAAAARSAICERRGGQDRGRAICSAT